MKDSWMMNKINMMIGLLSATKSKHNKRIKKSYRFNPSFVSILTLLYCFVWTQHSFAEVTLDGGFSKSIAIDFPEAIPEAFKFNLAIKYSSHAGVGAAGQGWTLGGIQKIVRINNGNGVNYNGNDTFSFSGGGKLVDVSGNRTEYHTENESFIKFEPVRSTSPLNLSPTRAITSWTVRYPNGVVAIFSGAAAASTTVGRHRYWRITSMFDLDGNSIKFVWSVPNLKTDSVLESIEFIAANNVSVNRPGIKFNWELPKTVVPIYVNKIVDASETKLASIISGYNVTTAPIVVKTYKFTYNTSVDCKTPLLSDTGKHRLSCIQEYGDPQGVVPTPDGLTTIEWTGKKGDWKITKATTAPNIPANWKIATSGDFNGDGKTDFIAYQAESTHRHQKSGWGDLVQTIYTTVGGASKLYLSNGDGSFAESLLSPQLPISSVIGATGDFNGDGFSDILVYPVNSNYGRQWHPDWDHQIKTTASGQKIYYGAPGTLATGITFKTSLLSPQIPAGSYIGVVGDFDADGRTDFISYLATNDYFSANLINQKIYLSTSFVDTLSPGSPVKIGPTIFNASPLSIPIPIGSTIGSVGDFNGDGRTDFVAYPMTNYGKIEVFRYKENNFCKTPGSQALTYISTGKSFITKNVQVPDKGSIRASGDFNGDGLTDLVTFGWNARDSNCDTINSTISTQQILLSDGKGAFIAQAMTLSLLDKYTIVSSGDLNGDGRSDLVVWPGKIPRPDYLPYPYPPPPPSPPHDFMIAKDSSFEKASSSLPSRSQVLLQGDFTGDGMDEFLISTSIHFRITNKVESIYLSKNPQQDLLKNVYWGSGQNINITYKPAPQMGMAVVGRLISSISQCGYGSGKSCGIANRSPRPLVSTITELGWGYNKTNNYAYSGGRYFNGLIKDRKNLGFQSITINDFVKRNRVVAFYYTNSPFEYKLKRKDTYSGGVFDTLTTELFTNVTPYPGTSLIRKKRSDFTLYDLSGGNSGSFLKTTDYTYLTNTGASAKNISTKKETSAGLLPREWRYNYAIDEVNWILNNVTKVSQYGGTNNLLKEQTITYATLSTKPESSCVFLISENRYICSSKTYDTVGRLATVTDPLNRISTIAYDSRFFSKVSSKTNALQETAFSSYDNFGRLQTKTDVNGKVTTTTWTPYGWKKSILTPDGGGTEYAYFSPDTTNVFTWVDSPILGRFERKFFDGFGFVYSIENTSDTNWLSIVDKAKDAQGRLRTVTTPHFDRRLPGLERNKYLATVYDYYPTNQLKMVTYPDKSTTSYTYTHNSVTSTDANLNSVIKTYDANGKLISVQDSVSTTTFQYDALGQKVSATLIDGSIETWQYDSLGRLTLEQSPSFGIKTYVYDDVGNRIQTLDSKLLLIKYQYDDLNRLIVVTPAMSETAIRYTYGSDTASNASSNLVGRLTQVTDSSGSKSFNSYDEMGRVTSMTINRNAVDYTFSYGYNLAGEISSKTYPDGSVATYRYTKSGNLLEVLLNNKKMGSWPNYLLSGKPTQFVSGNTLGTEYSYDDNDRLLTILSPTLATAPARYLNLAYQYDPVGNLKVISDLRSIADKAIGGVTDDGQVYTYDSINRLKIATGSYGARNFNYDPIGNMIQIANVTLNYPPQMQAPTTGTNFSASYDANGNMITKTMDGKTYHYTFNSLDQLMQVDITGTTTSTTTLKYDYSGQRTTKVFTTANGETITTQYISSDYQVRKRSRNALAVSEQTVIYLSGNGQKIASWTQDSENSITLPTNTLRGIPAGYSYYHNNHLGTPIAITNEAKALQSHTIYQPYGKVSKANSTGGDVATIKFTGQELDEETGLYYYNSRYYDPAIGRFISPDSIIPDPENTQSYNRYSYVMNNPVRYNDPTGKHSVDSNNGYMEQSGSVVGKGYGLTSKVGSGLSFNPGGMFIFGSSNAYFSSFVLGANSDSDVNSVEGDNTYIWEFSGEYVKSVRCIGSCHDIVNNIGRPITRAEALDAVKVVGTVVVVGGFTVVSGGLLGAPATELLLFSAGGGVFGAKRVKELKPKLIQENPRNLIPTQTKAGLSGSQVKRLTKDMKQNGFDQSKPVDGWRNPNTKRLEIQDGHNRTEAAKKAGLDKIPVQVWE